MYEHEQDIDEFFQMIVDDLNEEVIDIVKSIFHEIKQHTTTFRLTNINKNDLPDKAKMYSKTYTLLSKSDQQRFNNICNVPIFICFKNK